MILELQHYNSKFKSQSSMHKVISFFVESIIDN